MSFKYCDHCDCYLLGIKTQCCQCGLRKGNGMAIEWRIREPGKDGGRLYTTITDAMLAYEAWEKDTGIRCICEVHQTPEGPWIASSIMDTTAAELQIQLADPVVSE